MGERAQILITMTEYNFRGIHLNKEGYEIRKVTIWWEEILPLYLVFGKRPKNEEDLKDESGFFFGHIETERRFYVCMN